MPFSSVGSPAELWKLGLHERITRGTVITLVGQVSNGAAESRYSSLIVPGTGLGYQVTTGKTLFLTKRVASANVVTCLWLTGSGTTDVGLNSIAAPGAFLSEDSVADGVANASQTPSPVGITTQETFVSIGAGRFAAIRGLTASSILWVEYIGFEQ